MKLVFPELSRPIEFKEDKVQVLVLEAPTLFRSVIADIYKQCAGEGGVCVLSEKDTPIPFSKNAEIISSFIPFELNRKTLLNKIISAMEKISVNERFFLQTSEVLSSVERLVSDISYELSGEFECEKISTASLLKAVGIRIHEEPELSLSKVLDYMELVREYDREKLFIFVNLHSYFAVKEINAFYSTLLSHKYKALLIESHEHKRQPSEEIRTIDVDLCEIG